jgi:hypothetical protein
MSPIRRTLVALTVGLLVGLPAPASAQPEETPRTSWGDPDLRGIWDFRTLIPLERPSVFEGRATLTEEEAAQFAQQSIEARNQDNRSSNAAADVEGAYNDFWWDWGNDLADNRTSLITDPPNGRLPELVADARLLMGVRPYAERPVITRLLIGSPLHGPEDLGLSERCLLGFSSGPPILPSAYNNNLQVFQTPDYVVILTEVIHEARIVPLDGRPHLADHIGQWLGDSRGRWEGDTLVIETTNYTDRTGSFNTLTHSWGSGENLHLIERLRRVDADTLDYAFTIDDPKTFSRSFTASIPMKATEGPMYEYACHEGNYAMEGMLAGARVQEQASASSNGSGSR